MKLIRRLSKLKKELNRFRRAGKSINFVPTMGALHAGHLKLVEAAKKSGGVVVASIFVNPLQFTPKEDFKKYPRNLKRDAAILRKAGVTLLFAPSVKEMVSNNSDLFVEEDQASRLWCGAFRPGHFRGVLTIVAKLFHLVQPDVAYFGQKDYQQCHLIQKMVRDLNFPCKIRRVPTVREKDGLALSSRNVYLSPPERRSATGLVQSLKAARAAYLKGFRTAVRLQREMRKVLRRFPKIRTQYIGMASEKDLKPVKEVHKADVILLAATVGKTRLIDNWIVGGGELR